MAAGEGNGREGCCICGERYQTEIGSEMMLQPFIWELNVFHDQFAKGNKLESDRGVMSLIRSLCTLHEICLCRCVEEFIFCPEFHKLIKLSFVNCLEKSEI